MNVDPTYSRYPRVGDTRRDESFFPVVWTKGGRRSEWLDAEFSQNLAGVLAEGRDRS